VSITSAATQANISSKTVDLPFLAPTWMSLSEPDHIAEQELDNGRL
jgi:hypothetical protein